MFLHDILIWSFFVLVFLWHAVLVAVACGVIVSCLHPRPGIALTEDAGEAVVYCFFCFVLSLSWPSDLIVRRWNNNSLTCLTMSVSRPGHGKSDDLKPWQFKTFKVSKPRGMHGLLWILYTVRDRHWEMIIEMQWSKVETMTSWRSDVILDFVRFSS
jgi:hypothetical protein